MNDSRWAFEFGVPIAAWGVMLLLAACGALAWGFWWPRLGSIPRDKRLGLVLLRVATLLLILFMLLDPKLIGKKRQPAEDYVVALFDDSRSMRIAGDDGISRGERLMQAYEAHRADFEDAVREKHHLVMYRFGASASRIDGVKQLGFDQNESDVSGAVEGAMKDLAGAKIAAVVLFSDGVEQSPGGKSGEQSHDKGPAGVPIEAVGVDTESPWRDLDLKAVTAVRTNFDKSPVSLTVQVSAQGLKGRNAVVEAYDGDRLAASKPLTISEDSQATSIRLEYVPQNKGWTGGEARVRLVGGTDHVTENNARGYVVDNRDHPYRILYFAGRPNWQIKFVRRALEGDENLKLSSLIRISGPDRDFKFRSGSDAMANPLFEGFDEDEVQAPRYDEAAFIRLGMGQAELKDGYPSEAKTLFPYDLVIWGDIEADYFSPRQFEATRDFVARRGGALLLLGGPRALSEGHYAGTMIEGMLPVMLNERNAEKADNLKESFSVRPTVDGMLSGVWSLDEDLEKNSEIWNGMPQLFGANLFPMTRAGATELARMASDDKSMNNQPLFVWQRYGLGRTSVLATGETWQWRMKNEPENDFHEKFWRQMVRSLVNDVPAPVVLQTRGEELTAGKTARLEFLVRDKIFEKREGLATEIKITPPQGTTRDLPAEESIADPGVYVSEMIPDAPGMHRIDLTALNAKAEVVGTLQEAVYVNPDLREYRNANYNPDFLKTMARQSHGHFYNLDGMGDIAKAIPQLTTETEIPEIRHLWQNSALYALLALMFSAEWFFRRKQGQP